MYTSTYCSIIVLGLSRDAVSHAMLLDTFACGAIRGNTRYATARQENEKHI
jgi:hypothetical protein